MKCSIDDMTKLILNKIKSIRGDLFNFKKGYLYRYINKDGKINVLVFQRIVFEYGIPYYIFERVSLSKDNITIWQIHPDEVTIDFDGSMTEIPLKEEPIWVYRNLFY